MTEVVTSVILDPVQMNVSEVRFSLEHDEEFFIQFFLGDELTLAVPKFHIDVFHLMTSTAVRLCAFAIPRDHAKTTLAKLACVKYWLFSQYQFIMYLTNVSATAVAACKDIIGFIESDNFRSIYGKAVFDTKQEGVGFYRFTLTLPNNKGGYYEKKCILRALGAGQSVRGVNIGHRRPQLAIVDDLEDIENISTEDLYIKLKRWFYGTFRKCLDKKDHKIIHIGNMIANRCMLKEHCESEYWFSRRYGCLLADGKSLWPDAWPIDKLKADFNEYLKAGMIDVWFTEMMNLPIGAGRGLIRATEINYVPCPEPPDIQYGFITVDLAISRENWAHKTVVAVHGWTGLEWVICQVDGGVGIDPINLFDIIIEMAFKWRVTVVGVENTAYQASLQYVFPYLCMVKNIEGIEFVELHAHMRKTQRLVGWCAMLRDKQYAIPEGDFIITEQLLAYDPKLKENDDDYIDACAHGPQMIDNYSAEIQQVYALSPPPPVQNSYEVAGV